MNYTPRKISVTGTQGTVYLTEHAVEDGTYLHVASDVGHATIELDADQLFDLAKQIAGWFGAFVLTVDEMHERKTKLQDKIERVLETNQARCLDDYIDRNVVIRELLKELK